MRKSVKAGKRSTRLVAVIASPAELRRATRLRRLPDLFEVRLDALYPLPASAEASLTKLSRPLIITARHPREGGRNRLSSPQRRALLLHFLPGAAFVDVELRAVSSQRAVLHAAKERKASLILSFHDLRRTPTRRQLNRLVARAEKFSPDLLKIVTRADSAADLERLLAFFDENYTRLPLAVMGMGRWGRRSRVALARRGSRLHYVHLGTAAFSGQLSLAEAQRLNSVR